MLPRQPIRLTLTQKGQSIRKQLSHELRSQSLTLPPISKKSPQAKQSLKRILNSLAKQINTTQGAASTRLPASKAPRSLSPISSNSKDSPGSVSEPNILDIRRPNKPIGSTHISLSTIRENEGELIQSALQSLSQPQIIEVKVPRIAISDYFKEKYNHGRTSSEVMSPGFGRPSAKSRLSVYSTSPPPPLRQTKLSPMSSIEANKTIDLSDKLLRGRDKGVGQLKGEGRVKKSDLAKELWKEEMKAIRALEMQKKREQRSEMLIEKVKERLEGKHELEYKQFMQKHYQERGPSLEGVWQENKSSQRREESIRKIHHNSYGHFWERHKVPQPYSVLHDTSREKSLLQTD